MQKVVEGTPCGFLLKERIIFPYMSTVHLHQITGQITHWLQALRMTKVFFQPPCINPDFIQPEFTASQINHNDSHRCDFLFSQPRKSCFALLTSLNSPSKPSPVTLSSRKFLCGPHQQTLGMTLLWLSLCNVS